MHGPARYLAPCVAALLLGSTTGLADGASAPDARLAELREAALASPMARAEIAVIPLVQGAYSATEPDPR